jgi:hypothetical protein
VRRAAYARSWPKARNRIVEGVHERLCNHCSEWLWSEEFRKARWCHLGRAAECRLCNCARQARYRARRVALRGLQPENRPRIRQVSADRGSAGLPDRQRNGRFRARNDADRRPVLADDG